MALARTLGTSIFNAQSNSAAATTSSSMVDASGKYSAHVYGRILNGGTGPTVPAYVALEYTPDNGTTWREVERAQGGTTASASYPFSFQLDLPRCGKFRLTISGNTAQAVTVDANVDTTDSV